MHSLHEILNTDGKRPEVIRDAVAMLQSEVSRKKGITGFAIKQGFKVVNKLDNGSMITKAVDMLLDGFVDALDPYFQRFTTDTTATPFASFLTSEDNAVANALLTVTDRKRDAADNRVLVKTYDSLRGSALVHVRDAVPALGQLIQKHALS